MTVENGGADDEGHRNDLHALHSAAAPKAEASAEAWEWRAPVCTGAPPAAREMHAAAVMGRALLVHGGRGGPQQAAALDELSVLCLRTLAWSAAPTKLARSGHAPALAPLARGVPLSRCLLVGGFDGGAVKRDVWQLVLADPAAPSVAAADVLVERGKAEGDEPAGRFSHAACAAGGAALVIFGGSTFEAEVDDLVPGALVV